jgi:hypothetical protein
MAAATERKKPWYLVVALLGGLAFGVGGGCDGYRSVSFFRNASLDPSALVQGIANDADRALVAKAFEAWLAAMDVAKSRVFPLGVAALLVGAAMIVFALRAMAGRPGARGVLVQLVIVQAALGVASFVLQRDVRAAEQSFHAAVIAAQAHEGVSDVNEADKVARLAVATNRLLPPVYLALRTIGSLLIVFAMTRRRSREFFEADQGAVSEQ